MPHTPSDWAPLQFILQDILLSRNEELSEFELFTILKSPPYKIFPRDALSDSLSLFQNHFILFNALYHLRDSWLKNRTGLLDIHCSCIRHRPWQAGQYAVIKEDKLRAYYLDWENLSSSDQVQVEALLNSFWSAFSGIPNHCQDNDLSEQHALDLLNLVSPFSARQLKQQYRKMLHKHHPDKGGNNNLTLQLHKAYERLKATCI